MTASPSRGPRPPITSRRAGAPRLEVLEPADAMPVAASATPDFDFAQALPLQVFVIDPQRRAYAFLNRRALRWLGCDPDTPPGQVPFLAHTHPDDHGRAEALLERLHGLADGEVLDIEVRSRRGDGAWRHLLCRMSVHRRDPDGTVRQIVTAAQDITDRVELEQQLRRAQKMEAVGQLAGGIAHDFNNLLTVMLGYAETLASRLLPDDPLRADARQIVLAGRRATLLTQQLLASARREESQPVPMDLNAACRSVETILRRVLRPDIQLRLRPAEGLRPILGDPAHVDQVLMNLAVNARDAMPEGGTLTLGTDNVDVAHGDAWHLRGAACGPHVRLRVEDTGIGMDDSVRARIFEPFFTTKPAHSGTGLGLSVVYGIVEQAGGLIEVESAPGQGARFDVLFPATEAAGVCGSDEVDDVTRAYGLETILLVEDDEGVRRMAREGLEVYGYHVIEAGSAEQALALADEFGRAIHLAVTDMELPGMSGGAFARAMAERHPGTRILFVSGYAEDVAQQDGNRTRDWGYLQKPFTPAALARAVRRAFTPSPASP